MSRRRCRMGWSTPITICGIRPPAGIPGCKTSTSRTSSSGHTARSAGATAWTVCAATKRRCGSRSASTSRRSATAPTSSGNALAREDASGDRLTECVRWTRLFPAARYGDHSRPLRQQTEARHSQQAGHGQRTWISVRGQPGSLQDDAVHAGLQALEAAGLSWDLRVPFWHLAEAAETIAPLPGLTVSQPLRLAAGSLGGGSCGMARRSRRGRFSSADVPETVGVRLGGRRVRPARHGEAGARSGRDLRPRA